MPKPSIFVGSSMEALPVAYAIQANLEREADVTVWDQGAFEPSQYTLEALTEIFARADFGVFVLSGDDVIKLRDQSMQAVRDNVVFELGLCIGALGRKRSFLVKPRLEAAFRLPSDLLGLTPADYQADRADANWRAAVGPACASIAAVVRKLGAKQRGIHAAVSGGQAPNTTLQARAAQYLRTCESAAGAAKEIKDSAHPEWRQLSVGLRVGHATDGKELSVVYVESHYQSNPSITGDKTFSVAWHKFYLALAHVDEPDDTYVLFEELPRLLKRPGELTVESGSNTPEWIRKDLTNDAPVGLCFCDTRIY